MTEREKQKVKTPRDHSAILIRMFVLLKRLETERCTLHRLAQLMKLSVRTVQRDIKLLQRSGFPIVMDPASNEFYLVSNYGVPAVQLTFTESLAMMILLRDSEEKIPSLSDEAKKGSLKIASYISPAMLDEMRLLQQEIQQIPEPKSVSANQPDLFFEMLTAISQGKILRIHYKSPADPDKIITTFQPYSLFWGKRAWYTAGYAGLFGEIRILKLNRILQLETTGGHFVPYSDFSLAKHLGNAWNMIPERGPDQRVILKFSPKVAQNVAEVRWHPTQQNKMLPDGSLEAAFLVSGLNEISWWILGYGAEVKVLSPPALRERIAEHLKKALSFYQTEEERD